MFSSEQLNTFEMPLKLCIAFVWKSQRPFTTTESFYFILIPEREKKPFESLMLVQAYNSPWLREYVQESGIKKANSRLFVETM